LLIKQFRVRSARGVAAAVLSLSYVLQTSDCPLSAGTPPPSSHPMSLPGHLMTANSWLVTVQGDTWDQITAHASSKWASTPCGAVIQKDPKQSQ
jgi:hypothetical protein